MLCALCPHRDIITCNMQLTVENIERVCPETEIYHELLQLDGKRILELGCGDAEITRDIATGGGPGREVIALEVDEIAHIKNLRIPDLPNVRFVLAVAQNIPLQDGSVDVVFMFKSLHHVPVELMEQSLREIHRVLRTKGGGKLYISEPIFAGEFNEILRLFHDERVVREAAFAAIQKSVEVDGLFRLVGQTFFKMPLHFPNFTDFDERILQVTYNNHQLNDALYQTVKQKFEQHMTGEDGALFHPPMRVDLLEKK